MSNEDLARGKMESNVIARLTACEYTNRRLKRLLSIQSGAIFLCAAAMVTSLLNSNNGKTFAELRTSLRVRELVVDSQGVERVRIGGDLPDAVIGGSVYHAGTRPQASCFTTARA